MSRKAFADRISAVEDTYRQWETGRKSPNWSVLARIAAATGCNPAWLLTGIGDPWAVREPDAATGNAIMAEAEAAFRAACNLMITAAPLTDGDTLPDELELDQLLLRVKTAIQQRHNELDANDPETDE